MRGLRIRTTAEKAQDPARLDNIRVELEYPETLDERQRAGVLASVHKCLIHNTLLYPRESLWMCKFVFRPRRKDRALHTPPGSAAPA